MFHVIVGTLPANFHGFCKKPVNDYRSVYSSQFTQRSLKSLFQFVLKDTLKVFDDFQDNQQKCVK